MTSIPIEAVFIIGICILGFIAYSGFRDFKTADKKQRFKYIKAYIAVAVVSLILFFGIKYSGLPQILFPEYYRFDHSYSEEEMQHIIPDYLSR